MIKLYSVDKIMENLSKMDDYNRTDSDSEQDAIKIAKFLLKQINPDIQFKVNLSEISTVILEN